MYKYGNIGYLKANTFKILHIYVNAWRRKIILTSRLWPLIFNRICTQPISKYSSLFKCMFYSYHNANAFKMDIHQNMFLL